MTLRLTGERSKPAELRMNATFILYNFLFFLSMVFVNHFFYLDNSSTKISLLQFFIFVKITIYDFYYIDGHKKRRDFHPPGGYATSSSSDASTEADSTTFRMLEYLMYFFFPSISTVTDFSETRITSATVFSLLNRNSITSPSETLPLNSASRLALASRSASSSDFRRAFSSAETESRSSRSSSAVMELRSTTFLPPNFVFCLFQRNS